MTDSQKTRDGILLLSVGLTAGFLSAACGFFIWYHNSAVGSSVQSPGAVATESAPSSPVVAVSTQAPSQAATPAVDQPSALQIAARTASAQVQQLPEGVVITGYSQPQGFAGNTVSVSSSGSGADYVSVSPVYAGSPYWTVGENGLIENPSVDPPSSKGRAYSY